MLVLIPAVEVFSADTLIPMLTLEPQDELSIQAPSVVMEFPYAPNTSTLMFTLIVTNLINTPVQVGVNTAPNGQPPISGTATIPPYGIAGFAPAGVNCPANTACRIQLVSGGTTAVFGALLSILTPAGQQVGYVAPNLIYATQ
jgi:hypothetical protein